MVCLLKMVGFHAKEYYNLILDYAKETPATQAMISLDEGEEAQVQETCRVS